MSNNFKDNIDKILISKNYNIFYSDATIKKAMEVLQEYGVNESRLLRNLENLETIRYGERYNENFQKNPVAVFSHMNDNFPGMEIRIGHASDYDVDYAKNIEVTDLSRGVIDCLSVRYEGVSIDDMDSYYDKRLGYQMGMDSSLSEVGKCVQDQLANEISPNTKSIGFYVLDGSKYRFMNEYFDILMKIDGKNLVDNYFNTNDDFKYNPSIIDLNNAIKELKVQLNENVSSRGISDKYKIFFENENTYFLKGYVDKLNEAYCQYAGLRLKELPADEVDFYKGQIMSLPGMTDEHLKILENPKEVDKQIFENRVNDILNDKERNNAFDNNEKRVIFEAVNKIEEYGVDRNVILDNLSKIEDIRYIDRDKALRRGIGSAEFCKTDFHGRGKDDAVEINITYKSLNYDNYYMGEDIPLRRSEEVPELAERNSDFAYGIVNALSVKESNEKGGLFKDKELYTMGMDKQFEEIDSFVRNYVAKDIYESNIQLFSGKDNEFENINYNDRFCNISRLEDHLNLLVENDGGYLIKNFFEKNDDFSNDIKVQNLEEAIKNSVHNLDKDFGKVYCEYLGEHTAHLSDKEFENVYDKVCYLYGIKDEHLEILRETRENVINNEKENDKNIENIKSNSNDDEFDL